MDCLAASTFVAVATGLLTPQKFSSSPRALSRECAAATVSRWRRLWSKKSKVDDGVKGQERTSGTLGRWGSGRFGHKAWLFESAGGRALGLGY